MHFDRILAIALISSLAACGSEPPPGTEVASEPAVEKPVPKADRFANMFVDEVTQSYNPGLQIGETFPSIRALYQGEEISSIDQFVPDRGAIFIAVRSVNW